MGSALEEGCDELCVALEVFSPVARSAPVPRPIGQHETPSVRQRALGREGGGTSLGGAAVDEYDSRAGTPLGDGKRGAHDVVPFRSAVCVVASTAAGEASRTSVVCCTWAARRETASSV